MPQPQGKPQRPHCQVGKKSKHKIAKMKGNLTPKPLLLENPHHFVLFPIQHNNIWRMYKKAEALFWTAKEIDLSADASD
jgi:ribonucleotide reductase beta subunit family protein with ferritin-like domain